MPLLGIVEAVYEWQGAPLVFLIDADSVENEGQLRRIRRLPTIRGDAPYLAVVAPGKSQVCIAWPSTRSLLGKPVSIGNATMLQNLRCSPDSATCVRTPPSPTCQSCKLK